MNVGLLIFQLGGNRLENFSQFIDYPLFKGIKQKDLFRISNCFGLQEKDYAKGDYIWHAGDEALYLGVVTKGQINIIRDDILGNRTIISNIHKGNTFGEAYAISEVVEYPVSIQAATDTKILLINKHKLTTPCPMSCNFHNQLIKNLLWIIARKNIRLSSRIECITKKTIKQKVVFYLLDEMKMSGQEKVSIPFNRKELSDYLNVNRSALSRVLSTLSDEEIIHYNKNEFKILDMKKIEKILYE